MQNILNAFINPDDAARTLQNLVIGAGLYTTFYRIGVALIVLFVLLEIYNMWLRGGTLHDLFMLGLKIAIVNYLISPASGEAPLESIVMTAYGYFAHLGQYIASAIGGQQFQDLWTTLNTLSASINLRGTGNLIQQIAAIGETLFSAFLMMLVFGLFLFVFMIVLAIYVFAVLASRMFLVVSILLAPLLLPFALWKPMGSFVSRWVSTTIHAFLLPVIGAITLVVAISLGMVSPLQNWVRCVQATTGPAYQCIGQQMASFITATIGGLVAVFIMASVDRVVSSFLGAAEVTAAGLIGARWATGAAGAPFRAARAARAERAREARATARELERERRADERAMRTRAEVVLTEDLETGEATTIRRITAPVETPQV